MNKWKIAYALLVAIAGATYAILAFTRRTTISVPARFGSGTPSEERFEYLGE
jgi:hypothetical protein